MSRCMVCDYCPSAPSLSLMNEKRGVRLDYDDSLNGWSCLGRCNDYNLGLDQYDDVLDEDEFVEIAEIPAPVSET